MTTAQRHPLITALRRERRRVHLSQQRLADVIGVHRTTIQNAEAGRFDPRLTVFIAQANALGFGVTLVRRRRRDAAWRRELNGGARS
jgi:DNA-binding XRE family transcriptional regulator